jgi:hypothetical protein
MTEREKFEAWCREEGINPDKCDRAGVYSYPSARVAWRAWQASRRAALEEACAAIKAEDDRQNDNDYMLDSDDCIRVVRALADGDATIDAALAKQAKGV